MIYGCSECVGNTINGVCSEWNTSIICIILIGFGIGLIFLILLKESK